VAVALLPTGGGIERRDAGEARALRIGADSADPAGLADEFPAMSVPQPVRSRSWGAYSATRTAISRSSSLASTVSARQRATRSRCDPHLDALRSSEPSFDAIKPDLSIQGARGNAHFGIDGVKQPPQPVLGLGALPNQGLAMIDDQLDLTRLRVLDRERHIRVTERRAGRSRARRCCRTSRTTARPRRAPPELCKAMLPPDRQELRRRVEGRGARGRLRRSHPLRVTLGTVFRPPVDDSTKRPDRVRPAGSLNRGQPRHAATRDRSGSRSYSR
jgi:plasmid stabilization system protein ParE